MYFFNMTLQVFFYVKRTKKKLRFNVQFFPCGPVITGDGTKIRKFILTET